MKKNIQFSLTYVDYMWQVDLAWFNKSGRHIESLKERFVDYEDAEDFLIRWLEAND